MYDQLFTRTSRYTVIKKVESLIGLENPFCERISTVSVTNVSHTKNIRTLFHQNLKHKVDTIYGIYIFFRKGNHLLEQ